jgi:hypothetical protein
MSGIICDCNEQIKNLGVPNCITQIGRPSRLTFVPLYTEAGVENYIDTTTATLDSTYFNGKQYATDPYSRFYPLPIDLKNVEMPKGDAVYQEFDDGTKKFVRFGARSLTAILPDSAPVLIGKLHSMKCGKWGVYITTDTGNLVGIERTKGMLYPMRLSDNTLNAMWQFATGSTLGQSMLSLEFHPSDLDEQINFISNADISIDLVSQWKGKLDTKISQVTSARGATTFSVDIYSDFGSAKTKDPIENLVAADLVLYNITTSSAVTISTLVESTTIAGRYVVTFTSQTTTNDLRLSLGTTDAAKALDDSSWSSVIIGLD